MTQEEIELAKYKKEDLEKPLEDAANDIDELKPLEVKITNQPKEKEPKNPTSEDTIDIYDIKVTDQEIREMEDAQ